MQESTIIKTPVGSGQARKIMPQHTDIATVAEPLDLKGKVLYIEDNPLNVELVEAALSRYPGIRLVTAATGMEGVRLARSEKPDFVLLDMHLPDIGGLEVVRALNEEIAAGQLRITLLTADSLSMDIVKAMSLGAYDYWLKPMNMSKLEAGLKRALGKGARHE